MASGTVGIYFEHPNSQKEIVYLTQITDGDIFRSRKFSNIHGAELTINGATAGTVAVSFSGGTATMHPGIARSNCTLVLRGK